MAEFNTNGGLEISPGPRGFSVVGVEVSADGKTAHFLTDVPSKLNGIALPPGPRGPRGEYGDPGEARLRIDTSSGYRVFYWDTATAGENCVYADSGVRELTGSVRVHRSGNVVTTTSTTPATLPAGFRPAVAGVTGTFTTVDPWPETMPGTQVSAPITQRGLEGYNAAVAQGFPGTATQWIQAVYGVLPTNGVAGQYLGFGPTGPAWMALPRIGPGPWVNLTLTSDWRATANQAAQVRINNGTVEMIGNVSYQGPLKTAGVWGADFVKIGTLPPAYAPDAHYDFPVRVFRGDPNQDGMANFPIVGRVDIDTQGQLYLGAFWYSEANRSILCRAGQTNVNLGALPSYSLRNSSNGA